MGFLPVSSVEAVHPVKSYPAATPAVFDIPPRQRAWMKTSTLADVTEHPFRVAFRLGDYSGSGLASQMRTVPS